MSAIPMALHRPAPHPFDGMCVEAARAFLRRLDPHAERFTIQVCDDIKPAREKTAEVHHIMLDGPGLDTMRGRNALRLGIFATVNETDGRGRKAHNITRVRALFCDLDGSPLDPVLAAGRAPHLVVASSPGRWHCYWLVSDCPLDQFGRAQKAIARRFNGDPNVNDLPRVMRLPGFLHQKGEPFQTKMIGGHDGEPYTLAEIVGTLGLTFDEPRATGHTTTDDIIGEGSRNATLFAFGRRLHAQGKSDDEIDAAMRRENAARCNPPLPEGELVGLIRNVQTAKDDPAWAAPNGATSDAPHDNVGEAPDEAASEGAPYYATATITRADTVQPIPIRWLWHGWLARGKLHILGGAAGTGKTTIAVSMMATVSAGGCWPDGAQAPRGNVAIWSGEDDFADTLVPRLIAAGADRSRVHLVSAVMEGNERRAFDPATDMPALARALANIGDVRLLVVDPVVSAVAGDSHKNAEVRRGLQPLADLASKLDCALLGITHFSKGTAGREPLERVTGSIAFGAVARVVMVAAKKKADDDAEPVRLFARAKSNIGRDDGGFTYDLHQCELDRHPGLFASRVAWGEAVEGTARELLAEAEADERDGDGGTRGDARDFLRDLLADGPLPTKAIKADADGAGFSWRTIRRAQNDLGIVAKKEGGRFGSSAKQQWVWCLPDGSESLKVATNAEGVHQKRVDTFRESGHLQASEADDEAEL